MTATVTTTTLLEPVSTPTGGLAAGPILGLVQSLPPQTRRTAVEKLRAMSAEERFRMRRDIESAPEGERAALLMRALGIGGTLAPDWTSTVAQLMTSAHPEMAQYLAAPRGTPYVVQADHARPQQYRASESGPLPEAGRQAPPFHLITLEGKPVTAETFRGRPLVLEFGSLTCPVFRANIAAMNLLADAVGDRAAFLLVYTLEAHPQGSVSPYSDGEWVPDKNFQEGVLRRQPSDASARMALAREAVEKFGVRLPVAVDSMDNKTWAAFGSRANSAFVLDSAGVIVAAQEWTDPDGLRAVLDRLIPAADRP
ncbi:MAG: redoxin domain-containing protein [Candidatus Sumerlaeaceae bacterium]|nr:redoxin domain-containing protein [Candidatus Sumerlaeaceae bacterium]